MKFNFFRAQVVTNYPKYYTIIKIFYFQRMSSFNQNHLQEKTISIKSHTTMMLSAPIQDRFYFKELIKIYPQYNIYEGVDSNAMKMVTIYLKPINSDFNFSKKIKEQLRNKISPAVKCSGIHKIDKSTFNVQVHQKYGPSLKTMFSYIRQPLTKKDFLLLMYQLVRLVQKFATIGYVYRELDMQHIAFDAKPEKSDLFLLNVFPLKKKGEESPPLNTRFCSRGAHLGLRASHKDDLQSICYILLNISSRGSFLKKTNSHLFYQSKAQIDLTNFKGQLPQIFKKFYNYTLNLNYEDQINYFQWRSELYKLIGKEALSHPYCWMIAKKTKNNKNCFQSMTGGTGQAESLQAFQEDTLIDQLEDQLKPQDMSVSQRMTNKCIQKPKR